MTWLTALEYLCHKWPQICSTCKHFLVLSSFMIYHRVCKYINTTGITSGAGTCYPSVAHEFTSGFYWSSRYSIFSFICMFSSSLFVLFLLPIVLSVLLRYPYSDYPFGVFKLFLDTRMYWNFCVVVLLEFSVGISFLLYRCVLLFPSGIQYHTPNYIWLLETYTCLSISMSNEFHAVFSVYAI
jgi:hypothetical protein